MCPPISQKLPFRLTLIIAFAAIRKSVARSLTVLIFAANSRDGGSSVSKSFKARCSIVPCLNIKSLHACRSSSRRVRSLITDAVSTFWLSLSWYSSSSSSKKDTIAQIRQDIKKNRRNLAVMQMLRRSYFDIVPSELRLRSFHKLRIYTTSFQDQFEFFGSYGFFKTQIDIYNYATQIFTFRQLHLYTFVCRIKSNVVKEKHREILNKTSLFFVDSLMHIQRANISITDRFLRRHSTYKCYKSEVITK